MDQLAKAPAPASLRGAPLPAQPRRCRYCGEVVNKSFQKHNNLTCAKPSSTQRRQRRESTCVACVRPIDECSCEMSTHCRGTTFEARSASGTRSHGGGSGESGYYSCQQYVRNGGNGSSGAANGNRRDDDGGVGDRHAQQQQQQQQQRCSDSPDRRRRLNLVRSASGSSCTGGAGRGVTADERGPRPHSLSWRQNNSDGCLPGSTIHTHPTSAASQSNSNSPSDAMAGVPLLAASGLTARSAAATAAAAVLSAGNASTTDLRMTLVRRVSDPRLVRKQRTSITADDAATAAAAAAATAAVTAAPAAAASAQGGGNAASKNAAGASPLRATENGTASATTSMAGYRIPRKKRAAEAPADSAATASAACGAPADSACSSVGTGSCGRDLPRRKNAEPAAAPPRAANVAAGAKTDRHTSITKTNHQAPLGDERDGDHNLKRSAAKDSSVSGAVRDRGSDDRGSVRSGGSRDLHELRLVLPGGNVTTAVPPAAAVIKRSESEASHSDHVISERLVEPVIPRPIDAAKVEPGPALHVHGATRPGKAEGSAQPAAGVWAAESAPVLPVTAEREASVGCISVKAEPALPTAASTATQGPGTPSLPHTASAPSETPRARPEALAPLSSCVEQLFKQVQQLEEAHLTKQTELTALLVRKSDAAAAAESQRERRERLLELVRDSEEKLERHEAARKSAEEAEAPLRAQADEAAAKLEEWRHCFTPILELMTSQSAQCHAPAPRSSTAADAPEADRGDSGSTLSSSGGRRAAPSSTHERRARSSSRSMDSDSGRTHSFADDRRKEFESRDSDCGSAHRRSGTRSSRSPARRHGRYDRSSSSSSNNSGGRGGEGSIKKRRREDQDYSRRAHERDATGEGVIDDDYKRMRGARCSDVRL